MIYYIDSVVISVVDLLVKLTALQKTAMIGGWTALLGVNAL